MKEAGRGTLARGLDIATVEGLVIRTESGFHRILTGDRTIICRTPKRLLGRQRTATAAVVIGDRVRARVLSGGTGMIDEILPRANELVRGAAGGSRYRDVIAANMDQLVIVHSLKEPELNPARVDRFVLMGEAAEVPVLICLNKLDLVPDQEAEALANPYRRAGYAVILTCARSGQGIDEFRDAVTGKVSAVVGPSGVGKSSLLNRMQPGLRLRTAEISESTGKGRHTTTTAELLPIAGGGWIADTPGLRELAVRDVEPQELEWLFPEFRPYLGACRFSDCSHRAEEGCSVRAAVEEGVIPRERYRSYRRIYDELDERRRW